MASVGTAKTLRKLERSIEAGDYYGAHQIYLTICTRYVKLRKYDEAQHLFVSGAKLLCSHSQLGSALELLETLIQMWEDAGIEPSTERLEALVEVLDAFPTDSDQLLLCIKRANRWITKTDADAAEQMSHCFGLYALAGRHYDDAIGYFKKGNLLSAEALARVLLARIKVLVKRNVGQGPLEGIFLHLCMVALSFLSTGKVGHAFSLVKTFLDELAEVVPSQVSQTAETGDLPYVEDERLQLASLSVIAAQRGDNAADEFNQIRESLGSRVFHETENPDIGTKLDTIGQMYFSLPPAKIGHQPGNNMLADLMSALMGGGTSSNNALPPPPHAPTPSGS